MTVHFLGDVHLGKSFQTGTPLSRRGDREAMQWVQFILHLNTVEPGDIHIQVGDLFDRFQVSYDITYNTAKVYRDAAKRHPLTTFVILRGNHDASRDLERVSSFDVFEGLVDICDNIIVVTDKPCYLPGFVFLPWSPEINSSQMVDLVSHSGGFDKAVGHYDVVAIGDTSNLVPAEALKALGVKHIYTGHDHLPRELEIGGLPVTVIGSMQPYSHGEDPDEKIYVTRTLDQVLAAPDSFRDKCLRVILQPDEVFDVQIDCLSLQISRSKVEGEDLQKVDFEAFDLEDLFKQACNTVGLTENMVKLSFVKLQDARL